MRTSTAYFAGVGTVIAAVAAGLGGGYLAANIANPPPGVSKLERRMSSEPISVAAAPTQPVPRAVAANPATTPAQEPQTQATSDVAPPAANNAPPVTTTIRVEEKPAGNVAAAQPVQPALQPTKLTEPKSAELTVEKSTAPREVSATPRDASVPRDAYAKVRDADIKRAEAEKRRAERRQAWAERRKAQPRDQELDAVEERVREVTEPRRIRIREDDEPRAMLAERPSRADVPRIRLFGLDD